MNLNRLAVVLGLSLLLGAVLARWSRPSTEPTANQADISDQIGRFGHEEPPPLPNLATLIEYSSDIVVARIVSSTSGDPEVLATASSQGEPPEEVPVLNTEVEIDEVLKGDLEVDDSIVYSVFAELPVTSAEINADASSEFPVLWPTNTEFVLFLGKEFPEAKWYYVVSGACGRILTDQSTVSCSDGARTVSSFMTGLSRQVLIDAILDEVEDPSATLSE